MTRVETTQPVVDPLVQRLVTRNSDLLRVRDNIVADTNITDAEKKRRLDALALKAQQLNDELSSLLKRLAVECDRSTPL